MNRPEPDRPGHDRDESSIHDSEFPQKEPTKVEFFGNGYENDRYQQACADFEPPPGLLEERNAARDGTDDRRIAVTQPDVTRDETCVTEVRPEATYPTLFGTEQRRQGNAEHPRVQQSSGCESDRIARRRPHSEGGRREPDDCSNYADEAHQRCSPRSCAGHRCCTGTYFLSIGHWRRGGERHRSTRCRAVAALSGSACWFPDMRTAATPVESLTGSHMSRQ